MTSSRFSALDELRQRAEAVVRRRSGTYPKYEGRDLEHELSVKSIELEMQKEALREAKRELEASRAEYCALLDHAPAAYVVIGPDQRIKTASAAAAALLGSSGLVGVPLAHFVIAEEAEAFEVYLRRVVGTNERVRALFNIRSYGALRSVLFEGSSANVTNGEWYVVLADVTEFEVRQKRSPSFCDLVPANLVIVVVMSDTARGLMIAGHFRSVGLESFFALDGFEALEFLKSSGDRHVVVLTDSETRSLDRPEFYVAARAVVPTVRIVRNLIRNNTNSCDAAPLFDFEELHNAILRAMANHPAAHRAF